MGVRFAEIDEELPYSFEAMLDYPEIYNLLEDFMLQYYANIDDMPDAIEGDNSILAPDGFRFVVLNVCGRALVTLLPENKETLASGAWGYTYSCSCSGSI